MLNDYKITSPHTSIKGKKVRIIDSGLIRCVVIEHIFENICIVRWPLLRNKTGQGIEFIKDLEIIKEDKKMGKIRSEEYDDEKFEDTEIEKFSKTKKMKKKTKENTDKVDKPTNIIKLKKNNGKKKKKG